MPGGLTKLPGCAILLYMMKNTKTQTTDCQPLFEVERLEDGTFAGTDQQLAQAAASEIATCASTEPWKAWSGPVVTFYRSYGEIPTERLAAACVAVAKAMSAGMDISALVLHKGLTHVNIDDCRPTVFDPDDGYTYLRGNAFSRGYGESFVETYREQFDRLVVEGNLDTSEQYQPYLSPYWEDDNCWKVFGAVCPTGALREDSPSAQQFVLRQRYLDEAAEYGLTAEVIIDFLSLTGLDAEKMNACYYIKRNSVTTRVACADAKMTTEVAESVVYAIGAILSHVNDSVRGKGIAEGLVPLSIREALVNPATRTDVQRDSLQYQRRHEGKRWLDDKVLVALRQFASAAGAQVVHGAAHGEVAGDLLIDYIESGAVLNLTKNTSIHDATLCLAARRAAEMREGEDEVAAALSDDGDRFSGNRKLRSLFGELVRLKPELATEALAALLARPGIVGGGDSDWHTPYGYMRGFASPGDPSIDAGALGKLMRKRGLKMTKNRLKSLVRFTAYLSNLEAFNPYLLKFLLGTEKHGKKAAKEWQLRAKSETGEREQAALNSKPALCVEEADTTEYITVTTGAYDAQ